MSHIKKEHNPYTGYNPNNQLRPPVNRFKFYETTGFDFGWMLLQPINIAQSEEEEPELAKQFSPGQKALYFWWFVDAEVTNGGFVQFYYNQKEKYIPAVLVGLDHIGASDMAALIRKAHLTFEESRSEIESARNKSLFNQDLYKRLKGLTELDQEYYNLRDNAMAQLEEYARKHPDEFCVDELENPIGVYSNKHFKTLDDQGILLEEYTIVNNRLHGTYKSYFETGAEKEILQYENSIRIGAQKFYSNGNTREVATLDTETDIIKVETFHLNGKPLKLEHFDANGQKKGLFKEWFEDGTLKESATFISHTEREGQWTKYWPSGFKRVDAICKDSKVKFLNYWTADGKQLMKDGNGLFINEFEMDMAITKTQYRYETEYKDYKRNGLMKQYVNDSLTLTQEFKDDVEHGKTCNYDEEGNITEEKHYKNGKLVTG